jgi:hypothetical protein
MWTERTPEQLQNAVSIIQADLEQTQDPLRAAQYQRVLDAINAHLGSTEVEIVPVGAVEVDTPVTEPVTPDEVVTEADTPEADADTEDAAEPTDDTDMDTPLDPVEWTAEWMGALGPEALPIGTYVHEEPEDLVTDPTDQMELPDDTTDPEPKGLSPVVESGTSGLWVDTRKAHKPKVTAEHEIQVLKQPRPKVREIAGTDPYLIRFDPELGIYSENGRMIADPTESRVIQENIEVIIEVAHYLAYLSNENPVITHDFIRSMDTILTDVGYNELPPFARNSLIRELNRLLTPTKALSIFKNRRQAYMVIIRHPFTFVVTDLEPRKSSIPARTDEITEQQYAVCEWDDSGSVEDQLFKKRVPRPTNHQQAIQLLDAVMGNPQLNEKLLKSNTAATVQRIIDLAHTFIQEALGWNNYFYARRARMIRGGNKGYIGRVRQVTGTQRAERFEPGSDVYPDAKQ